MTAIPNLVLSRLKNLFLGFLAFPAWLYLDSRFDNDTRPVIDLINPGSIRLIWVRLDRGDLCPD